MKIIQSLWTRPLLKKQDRNSYDRFDGGWTDKKYNYMSWALSCLQFRKFYDNVELYTDVFGKEILIDRLELPYTKVHVVLDELNHYHPDLWAVGKIYTYSLQNEPFLHVDGDAYIWRRFNDQVENADLVAQHLESDFKFYKVCVEEVISNFSYIPECIRLSINNNDYQSINAGIFGGTDVVFIKQFVTKAFEFINKNKGYQGNIDLGQFNAVYEQFLFYKIVKERQKEVVFFKHNIDESYQGLADFEEISVNTDFVHIVSFNKKLLHICEGLSRRLLLDYPEVYYRIQWLLEKHII